MTKFMTVKMGLVLWFSCRNIKPLNTCSVFLMCNFCWVVLDSRKKIQSVWGRIWPFLRGVWCSRSRRWAPRSSRNMISTLKGLRSRRTESWSFFGETGWVWTKHFPYEGLIHPITLDLSAAKNLSNMNILESFCMTFQLRKMIKRAQKVCW